MVSGNVAHAAAFPVTGRNRAMLLHRRVMSLVGYAFLLLGIGCSSRSSPSGPAPNPATPVANSQPSDVPNNSAPDVASADSGKEAASDRTAPEADRADAEQVLATALARAATEDKQVLVHVGAPG